MKLARARNRENGQGLVEYALILALVAIVVIVVAFVLGQAGALGAKYNTSGQHAIEITGAQCIAVQSTHQTGLWVVGFTNEDLTALTGSTEQAVGTGLQNLPSPLDPNGPNGFKFHPLLSQTTADLSLCPRSVVIQSTNGAIALSPVSAEMVP